MSKRKIRKTTNTRRGNRLLGYIRVSDTRGREGEKFLSPDIQKNDQLKWAAAHGCVIIDWVVDLDRTGTESSSRNIATSINRIEAGEADGILVRKIDRWGRNTLDSLLNIGELQSVGGFIASTSEDLDNVDTPAGHFSLTILLAIAEMFSADMAKGWRSIHELRREIGKTAHGGRRLGYIRRGDLPEGLSEEDRKRYEFPEHSEYAIDPTVAPWIGQAIGRYLAGVSLRKITEELNAAGIRSTRGNPFSYMSLKKTLTSGFYAGLIYTERNGEVEYLPGAHQAIVPRETWDRFMEKLHDGSAPRSKHAQFRCTRLVYCAACGRRMASHTYMRNGVIKTSWSCTRKPSSAQSDFCPEPAIIYQPLLEDKVFEWLAEHTEGQTALDAQVGRARRAIQAEKDVASIDRDLERQRKRLSILADKVLDGDMPGAMAKVKEEEITTAIARLEEARRAAAGDLTVNSLPDVQVFGALRAGWDVMDSAIFNEGLRKVISQIFVTKAGARNARAKVRIVGRWETQVKPAA